MNLPSRLMLTAAVADEGLAGAWFEVELPMQRKNNYGFPAGPADTEGRLTLTAADLTASVREEIDLFPMDYVGLTAGWTGELVVRAVNRPAVARLRDAHATWGDAGYSPGFMADLDRLDGALSVHPPSTPIVVFAAIEADKEMPVRIVAVEVGISRSTEVS
jgi:hypothetical protein